MKTLVVYDSLYGNTEKVAKAIADASKLYGEVQLTQAGELEGLELQGEDVLFLGCPTHNQNVSPDMKVLLEKISRGALRGVQVATFDTRYEMPTWIFRLTAGTAANKLAGKLRRRGAKVLVRPECFLIEHHHKGPLLAGEYERAKAWSKTVLEKAQTQQPSAEPRKAQAM